MSIAAEVARVARLLKAQDCKVVFAESCTGGLLSASLTRVPGISAYHCGGVVVYRNATKMSLLGLPAGLLADPGPVSKEVTERMAVEVLRRTPEADISVAVTGHLGPDAPPRLDGVVFVAVARRTKAGALRITRLKKRVYPRGSSRLARQKRAVEDALRLLAAELEAH